MAISAIERAFELARSGGYKDVGHIKRQIKQEGLDADQIYGKLLSRQLNDAIKQALHASSEPNDLKSVE